MTHPERPLVIDRLAPTLAGEEQSAGTDSQGRPVNARSYLPLAETLRGGEKPLEYARSSMSYPLQTVASLIGAKPPERHGGYPNYYTYGKDPGKYALNSIVGSIPLGGKEILDATGLGTFADQGLGGVIGGQTGLRTVRAPGAIDRAVAEYVRWHPHASDKEIDRFKQLVQHVK